MSLLYVSYQSSPLRNGNSNSGNSNRINSIYRSYSCISNSSVCSTKCGSSGCCSNRYRSNSRWKNVKRSEWLLLVFTRFWGLSGKTSLAREWVLWGSNQLSPSLFNGSGTVENWFGYWTNSERCESHWIGSNQGGKKKSGSQGLYRWVAIFFDQNFCDLGIVWVEEGPSVFDTNTQLPAN